MASVSRVLKQTKPQRAVLPGRRQPSTRAYLTSDVPPNVQEARAWIAAWRADRAAAAAPISTAEPEPLLPSPPPTPANVVEAREWIAAWRMRKVLEASLAAVPETEPASPPTPAPIAVETALVHPPANVLEARQWIAAWKARQPAAPPSSTALQPLVEVAAPSQPSAPTAAPAPPPPLGPIVAVDGTLVFNKQLLDSASYEELLQALQAKVEGSR